jgi:hypothetical protein
MRIDSLNRLVIVSGIDWKNSWISEIGPGVGSAGLEAVSLPFPSPLVSSPVSNGIGELTRLLLSPEAIEHTEVVNIVFTST